jgi:5-methylcytosine-specific restriction endonuclease McrA
MSSGWRGGSTTAWRRLRALVLDRDEHTCQVRLPGCTGVATHADHITPKSRGGTDHPGNLRGSCRSCNLHRGTGPDPDPSPKRITKW